MSQQHWEVAFVAVAAVASALFVLVYGALAPWYRSAFGRSLIISEVSLSTLLWLSLLAYWRDFVIPRGWALAVIGLIALASVLRLGALVDEQILKRLRRR